MQQHIVVTSPESSPAVPISTITSLLFPEIDCCIGGVVFDCYIGWISRSLLLLVPSPPCTSSSFSLLLIVINKYPIPQCCLTCCSILWVFINRVFYTLIITSNYLSTWIWRWEMGQKVHFWKSWSQLKWSPDQRQSSCLIFVQPKNTRKEISSSLIWRSQQYIIYMCDCS